MWQAIVAIITTIAGSVSDLIKTKAETAKAKADAGLELEKAKIEYNKQRGIDAVESEKNKLKATPVWFKFVSYILLNYPIVLAYFSADKAKALFENMGIIPMWYAMLYVGVVGVIWGLPIASNWMDSVFSGIQQAWAMRQDKKIEKITALAEAKAVSTDQAKKEILDIMKKTTGLQGYTQAQVDKIVPVLDKVLNERKE